MDRYGEAIEFDLHTRCGLDILDFFRGKLPWGKLERLIRKLQQTPRSALQIALAMDEELAEASLADEKTGPSTPPPLEEYSPEVARLTDVYDRLGELIATVGSIVSQKAIRPHLAPRPDTAFDKVRARRRYSRHLDLVAEVEEAQRRFAASRVRQD